MLTKLTFAAVITANSSILVAADVSLQVGERVMIRPNVLTTVTCGGEGSSNSYPCKCAEDVTSSVTRYQIHHRQMGYITGYDYNTLTACTQAILNDFSELCVR